MPERIPVIPQRGSSLGRIIRFGVVGGLGVGVNLGMLWLLHGVVGMHVALASALAIETAVLHNFVLNDRWTFADRHRGPWTARITRFHGVSILGMLANETVLLIAVEGGAHYMLAGLAGVGAGFVVNFALNFFWNYGEPAPPATSTSLPEPVEDE